MPTATLNSVMSNAYMGTLSHSTRKFYPVRKNVMQFTAYRNTGDADVSSSGAWWRHLATLTLARAHGITNETIMLYL